MRRLPRAKDIEHQNFPELAEVFQMIDAEIATIIAGDPALHPVAEASRANPSRKPIKPSRHGGRTQRQAA
ncbi:hypothetical protein [Devosia sediminis]|uniref:Uncharacterized protein n=1 Tax=Devosia sediminis TaxID=2798801 RepID=A0A934IM30_9HYPH|nr:hypothetical protein [Devosia sediminis]MBJ3783173.1 hypothetical protein [Devosia sediminis]